MPVVPPNTAPAPSQASRSPHRTSRTTRRPALASIASIALLSLATALAACGGGDSSATPKDPGITGPTSTTPTVAAVAAVAAPPATAPAGQPVSITVRATDAKGAGVPNVAITFAVTEGGGTLGTASAYTDASGTATATWTLGRTVGRNTMTASSGSAAPFTVTIGGVAGPAASVLGVLGDGLTAPAGTSTGVSPQFVVVDRYGNAVPDAPVEFRVVSGGGTLLAAPTKTTANGNAAVGWWRLGSTPGTNVVEAAVTGIAQPIRFTATGRPVATPFALDVRYEDSTRLNAPQRDAIRAAATRVRALITATLPAVRAQLPSFDCGGVTIPALSEVVTNPIIYVFVRSATADTAFRAFTSATAVTSPCIVRTAAATRSVVVAHIVVNADYLESLERNGGIEKTITHEMLHALGVGTLWDADAHYGWTDLLNGRGSSDPAFTGALAVAAFGALPNSPLGAAAVPVEGSGGVGTAYGHWRASTFDGELMISGQRYIGYRPLSTVTVASLRDLGYAADLAQADAFALPKSGPAALRLQAVAAPACGGTGPLSGVGYVIDRVTGRVDRQPLRSLLQAPQ